MGIADLIGKWKVARVSGFDEDKNVIWLTEEEHKAMPGYSPTDANPYLQYYMITDEKTAYPVMPLPPNTPREQLDKMVELGFAKLVDGMILGAKNPIELKEENGKMYCSLKVFGDPNAPWEEMTYEDGLLHFLAIYKLERVD